MSRNKTASGFGSDQKRGRGERKVQSTRRERLLGRGEAAGGQRTDDMAMNLEGPQQYSSNAAFVLKEHSGFGGSPPLTCGSRAGEAPPHHKMSFQSPSMGRIHPGIHPVCSSWGCTEHRGLS